MHNTSLLTFQCPHVQVLESQNFETQQFHDSNENPRPAKPSTLPRLDFSMGSLPGMFCTPGAWPAANAGAATAAGTAVEPSAATAAGAGPSSGIVTGPCSKSNGIWARNKMKSQQNWDLRFMLLFLPLFSCLEWWGHYSICRWWWRWMCRWRWYHLRCERTLIQWCQLAMTGWQCWQLILSRFPHPSLFLELIPSNLAFKFSKLLAQLLKLLAWQTTGSPPTWCQGSLS